MPCSGARLAEKWQTCPKDAGKHTPAGKKATDVVCVPAKTVTEPSTAAKALQPQKVWP